MNKYFIYNNLNSKEDYNLIIEDRVIYPSSINKEDTLELNVYYYNKDSKELLKQHRLLQQWLAESGFLQFEEDKETKYKVVGINFTMKERREHSIHFNIKFTVEPLKYIIKDSTFKIIDIEEVKEEYTLENEGDVECYPIFKISSTGTVTINVNDNILTIENTEGEYFIDSDLKDCYNLTSLLNNNVTGELPILNKGINTVTITGNISALSIKLNTKTY